MGVPARFLPIAFVVASRRAPDSLPSAFGFNGRARWALPRGGEDRALYASVAQHLFVVALRRWSATTGEPLAKLATSAGRTPDRWTRLLSGQIVMQATDVGAFALAAPSGWPDPSEVQGTVRNMTEDLGQETEAVDAYRRGNPAPLRIRDVSEALRPDFRLVTILPEMTPEEQAAVAWIEARVPELLRRTVPALLLQVGLSTPRTVGRANVRMLRFQLCQMSLEPSVSAPLSPRTTWVFLRLRPDWPETVDAPDWSVLDGRFVMEIHQSDGAGRPLKVTVLVAVGDWNTQPPMPDGSPSGGWVCDVAPGSVTWDGDLPTVHVEPDLPPPT